MSEPLSAVEIEDVLSSIRRLVSEDLRPARGGGDVAASTAAPAGRSALILTPALRVVPDVARGMDTPHVAVPLQDVVASVGAAVAAQDEDWEPETGDAAYADTLVWADAVWDNSPTVAVQEPDGDAKVLREPAVAESSPGWSQGAVDVAEQAAADDGADMLGFADRLCTADADWVARAEAEVIAGLEAPETHVPHTDRQHKDGLHTDRQHTDGSETYGPFDLTQDDRELSFDEEVLRDLVRDLIREELQGHLGERITRNIRKLVRAEIARALAVQDLT